MPTGKRRRAEADAPGTSRMAEALLSAAMAPKPAVQARPGASVSSKPGVRVRVVKQRTAGGAAAQAAPSKDSASDTPARDTAVESERSATDEDAGGFASAVARIMRRRIGAAAAPVMAKRHTAVEKMAAAEIQRSKTQIVTVKANAKRRRAANVAADAWPPELEMHLRRLATKGVVALFNAISKHQKALSAVTANDTRTGTCSAQPSFLELLHASTTAVNAAPKPAALRSSSEAGGVGRQPSASFLRDDVLEREAARERHAAARDDDEHDLLDDIDDD